MGDSGVRPDGRIRQDQFGKRATRLYFRAVEADVLNRSDVIDYLDVSDNDLDDLQAWSQS